MDRFLFCFLELWVVGPNEEKAKLEASTLLQRNGYAKDASYTLVKVKL